MRVPTYAQLQRKYDLQGNRFMTDVNGADAIQDLWERLSRLLVVVARRLGGSFSPEPREQSFMQRIFNPIQGGGDSDESLESSQATFFGSLFGQRTQEPAPRPPALARQRAIHPDMSVSERQGVDEYNSREREDAEQRVNTSGRM